MGEGTRGTGDSARHTLWHCVYHSSGLEALCDGGRKEKQPKSSIVSNFPFQGIHRFREEADIKTCETRGKHLGRESAILRGLAEKATHPEHIAVFPLILSATCEMPA